jgi:hypothetical protein
VKGSAESAPAATGERREPGYLFVFETYVLDKVAALELLDAEAGSAARYQRAVALAKSGKARLETLTVVAVKSGMQVSSEGVDEVRYATEFAAPHAWGKLAAPTTYEMRSTGDLLELEPVVSEDGRTCSLMIAPKRVSLLDFRELRAMAEDSAIAQPRFETQRLTTNATILVNEPHYLGTLSGSRGLGDAAGSGETRLAFVRLMPQAMTAEQAKAPAKLEEEATINLEYRLYSTERATARELLASAGQQSPWQNLLGLLATKKARFEHLITMQTRSGERTVSEETQDAPFSNDFAAPTIATRDETTTRTITTTPPEEAAAKDGEKEKDRTTTETTTTARATPGAGVIPGYPAHVEHRTTGLIVETEASLNEDGQTLDLIQSVESVTDLGELKVTGLAGKYPAQTLFESRKLRTSLPVALGKATLIGTINPPGANGVNDRADSGRTWLLFVRATPAQP